MKFAIWYYRSLIPGRPVLKVQSRDLWNPPLVAGMEPIDCDVLEIDNDTVLYCPSL
jgi:hypothetical protein